jgi:LacI family transcriptional regulator
MKASLREVADAAGVSTSTVSRYLNGTLALREETERRVIEAVDKIGYERHRRRPVQEETRLRVIGLLLPEIGNQYFGALADAIVEAAERQGSAVIVGSTLNNAHKQGSYVELLTTLNVDAILYIGNYASNKSLGAVAESGLPVVVVDEHQDNVPAVDSVLADDYSGAYQAASYLLSLGHRKIALATGPDRLHSVRERRRGFQDALINLGVDPSEQLDLSGSFSDEFGASALTKIIAAKDRPTAVFAASDIIAVGIMGAARSLGVRIPEDLSIVGFDDIPAAEYLTPRLTTVHTPLDETARVAVGLLADRLDDPRRPVRHEVTSVALVPRESAIALDGH